MLDRCSFYLGMGKGLEGLGGALKGGWDQTVLYAASTQDYLHRVLQSIDDTASLEKQVANFSLNDADCAFTWHDSRLFARIKGQWVPIDHIVRVRLLLARDLEELLPTEGTDV